MHHGFLSQDLLIRVQDTKGAHLLVKLSCESWILGNLAKDAWSFFNCSNKFLNLYIKFNEVLNYPVYPGWSHRNQYFLTSSCHPAHVTNNIPFNLALCFVLLESAPSLKPEKKDSLNSSKCCQLEIIPTRSLMLPLIKLASFLEMKLWKE